MAGFGVGMDLLPSVVSVDPDGCPVRTGFSAIVSGLESGGGGDVVPCAAATGVALLGGALSVRSTTGTSQVLRKGKMNDIHGVNNTAAPQLHNSNHQLRKRTRMTQQKYRYFQTVNHAKVIWDPDCKRRGILGGHLNICRLIPKREEVEHLLTDSNLDFLSLSETWLNSNTPTQMIDIPGYVCFRKDRQKGTGGGVLTYVRKTFKCTEVKVETGHIECLVLKLILSPRMNFTVVTLCNPPSSSKYCNVHFYCNLDEMLKRLRGDSEIIVLGDFNINWLEKCDKQKLKAVTSKYKLHQQTVGPTRLTRTSKTQIDLMFTNKPERVIKT